MSEAHKGKKRPPLTKEQRRNISESHKGMRFTEVHKRRIAEALRGRVEDLDHREHIRQGMREWWSRQPRGLGKARMLRASRVRCSRWTRQQKELRRKNPYSSATNPREYSAWYHEHNPGYFAKKSKEWRERQPQKRRLAIMARKNRKSRAYVNAYTKLRRRLRHQAKSPPTFTADEMNTINRYGHLAEMHRQVKKARTNKRETQT